jgi:hypothetical protein
MPLPKDVAEAAVTAGLLLCPEIEHWIVDKPAYALAAQEQANA